ncbi:MAG: Uma2 family endonuclease [Candidatus Parabeggiatoa sp. nov. 1]|nr:MAG: Uma2 family endonuclease [Gammaproteobacteria bacterium]
MTEATALATETTERIQQGEWTYEDYLNLPDDGHRYEIIEGVLYMSNAPDIDHQFTVVKLVSNMENFVTSNQLGYVLTAPFEVHLAENTRPVQPDVLFIAAEKWPARSAKYFEGAPDLIVEVLSPSTRSKDKTVKFRAYEKAQVPEYWLADPKARMVEIYSLENQEYVLLGDFMGDEVIESKVLVGLKITADSLVNKPYT